MCFICENTWEKLIQITIYKVKINNVWFMSSNSKPYVKIEWPSNVKFANRELKMCFICENIWEKFIRITIYKFKISDQLWQICCSCHPVRRNVKIEHLKCRIWKQGFGCKKCLNCEDTFFGQLYGSCHLVCWRSTKSHIKIVLPKTGSVKNENIYLPIYVWRLGVSPNLRSQWRFA